MPFSLDSLFTGDGPSAFGWLGGGGAAPAIPSAEEQAQAEAAREAAALALQKRMRRQNPAAAIPEEQARRAADNIGPSPAGGSFGSLAPVETPEAFGGAPAVTPAATPPAAPPPVMGAPSTDEAGFIAAQQKPPMRVSLPTVSPTAAAPPAAPGDPAAPAAPSLLARLGNGINNNSQLLMALGAGMAGAPSIGTGMQRALTNAQPIAQQNQTVQALISRGVPQDIAQAAASNPAILQQIIPGVLGPKEFKFDKIKGITGQEQPVFIDTINKRMFDANTGKLVANSAGTNVDPQKWAAMSTDERLAAMPAEVRDELRAIKEGRQPSTGRNVQTLLPLVNQVWPDFDAAQYPVKLALRKSYTSGKDFQEVQALNTVSGHMGKLAQSADALDNSTFKPINSVRNWWSDHISDNPNLVRFRNDLVTTSNELAKAYHGGHVTDAAYAAFNKAINEAQTPEAMKAAIGEIAGLLESKVHAKDTGYRAGMDNAPLPQEYSAVNDEAKAAYAKINDWAKGIKPQGAAPAAQAPSAQPAAPAPKVGDVQRGYRFTGGNPADPKSWQKL